MLQVLDHDDRSHELLAVTAVDFCYSVIDSYTLLEPHTPHKPRKENLSWLCLCRELDLDGQHAADSVRVSLRAVCLAQGQLGAMPQPFRTAEGS